MTRQDRSAAPADRGPAAIERPVDRSPGPLSRGAVPAVFDKRRSPTHHLFMHFFATYRRYLHHAGSLLAGTKPRAWKSRI